MATVVRSTQGDIVDHLAWQHYGRVDDSLLRAVFNANPGLADQGPKLPEGVSILLPDINSTGFRKTVRIWD